MPSKWDGAFEVGGVYAGSDTDNKEWVQARQTAKGVAILVGYGKATMDPNGARSLARQLYRLARRFEAAQQK